MTLFQIILLAGAVFFAWKIYKFVLNMSEDGPNLPSDTEVAPKRAPQTPVYPGQQTTASLLDKADAAYEAGKPADARIYLERAEKADPDNPEVLNKLGFVLAKEGDLEGALLKYERSLAIDPGDDLTHNALAGVLRQLGRYDEAQDHYKSAASIDDSYAETYFGYGELLAEKNDHDGARMMFEKTLELDPNHDKARQALERLG